MEVWLVPMMFQTSKKGVKISGFTDLPRGENLSERIWTPSKNIHWYESPSLWNQKNHPTQKHHACFVGCSPKKTACFGWSPVENGWADGENIAVTAPSPQELFQTSLSSSHALRVSLVPLHRSSWWIWAQLCQSGIHLLTRCTQNNRKWTRLTLGTEVVGKTLFSTKTHVIQIGRRYITTVVQNRRLNTQNTIGRWSKIDNLGGLKVRYYWWKKSCHHFIPWEPKTFIFWGHDPYIEGLKPSFFMVLGSKGS